MIDPILASVLTLVGVVVLFLLYVAARGGFGRLGLACSAFSKTLGDAEFAAKIKPLLAPPKEKKARPSGVPLRMLAVLQRESRLLDFLLENIQGAADAQIGAAVRDIQAKAQSALKKHLVLEPVLSQQEGDNVEVPAGFDPSTIQLVGNVTGEPPFRGTLAHAGWRVKEVHLAPLPEGQDDLVLAPAQVELP